MTKKYGINLIQAERLICHNQKCSNTSPITSKAFPNDLFLLGKALNYNEYLFIDYFIY